MQSKRIPVKEIQPGMYIISVDPPICGWVKVAQPGLQNNALLVTTADGDKYERIPLVNEVEALISNFNL